MRLLARLSLVLFLAFLFLQGAMLPAETWEKNKKGCLAAKGKNNTFTIQCDKTHLLRVELSNAPLTSSPVDYVIRVLDKNDRVLYQQIDKDGADGTTFMKSAPCHLPYTGTYKVIIQDDGSDDCAPKEKYSLKLKQYPDPDKNEPNNDPYDASHRKLAMYMATSLQSGVKQTGMIT